MTWKELAHKIEEHFDLSELEDLCFESDIIKYENLRGITLKEKVRGLVQYCKRHGRLGELANQCKLLRPNENWPLLFTSQNKIAAVKFFMVQEIAHFINTPGRYGDQFNFTVTNNSHQVIQSLKLKFTFPKLENLIEKDQFYRFRQVVNHGDFSIQEETDFYRVTYQYENLLPNDSTELERACFVYAMELPDKDRWLNIVQNSQLTLMWQLFSSASSPLNDEVKINELYIDNYRTVHQQPR